MSVHLFLGGPLDQQWREVPRGNRALVVAVECQAGADTSRMVNYRREYVSLPGWVVPLHMFVAVGRRQTEIGDVLPGMVVGERRPVSFTRCADFDWPWDLDEAQSDLINAIKRRGFRP
jgi:hypothetical protein